MESSPAGVAGRPPIDVKRKTQTFAKQVWSKCMGDVWLLAKQGPGGGGVIRLAKQTWGTVRARRPAQGWGWGSPRSQSASAALGADFLPPAMGLSLPRPGVTKTERWAWQRGWISGRGGICSKWAVPSSPVAKDREQDR